jgi:ribosomal protein L17
MTSEGAAAEIRRAAALLREAQAVRRRLEKLATLATEAPLSSRRLLDEALVAVQRLADDLARHQRTETRRVQHALRMRRSR